MGRIGPLVRIIDAPEPVIGFRIWRVYAAGDLHSGFGRERWAPGAGFTAHCKVWLDDQAVPHWECFCGVHAFRDPRHLKSWRGGAPRRGGTRVTGAVALWGRIIEHELGFRAQYARPVALIESYYAQRVADVYGLPVLSRESLELEAEVERLRQGAFPSPGYDGAAHGSGVALGQPRSDGRSSSNRRPSRCRRMATGAFYGPSAASRLIPVTRSSRFSPNPTAPAASSASASVLNPSR
jgi:hypothetical protein